MKLLAATFIFVFSFVAILYSNTSTADALSGADFNPSRIIDDSVFYNNSRMSASDIQTFLDSKIPVCDTNGTGTINGQSRATYGTNNGNPPPYTCINEFTESISGVTNTPTDYCTGSITSGTKTSAEIIKEVSDACNINPQVLLVMLQKEQSLITDDWAWPTQYDKAMGYACPDSGPNNSANCDSEFFGFFNQVYNAAQAFRRYEANPDSYNYKANRNNFVLYHPNTACGGNTIFIDNQATANLYIYTPYQPNQAALDNLYGTGDTCSAYGNRNFWRMFNDWFGSTIGTPFFIVEGTAAVNILGSEDNYYYIPSYELLSAYGYPQDIDEIEIVDASFIDGKTNSGVLPRTARFEDAAVYLIDNGRKRQFDSGTLMNTFGFTLGEEATLPASLGLDYPTYGQITTVVIEDGGSKAYSIEDAKKRHITESAAYSLGTPAYSTIAQVSLSKNFLDTLDNGASIYAADRLLKNNSTGVFTYWDGSELTQILSWAAKSSGMQIDYYVEPVDTADLSISPDVAANRVKDSAANNYILDNGKKFLLSNQNMVDLGFNSANFIELSDSLLAEVPTVSFSNLFQVDGGRSIYSASGGTVGNYLDWDTIRSKGYTVSDLQSINTRTESILPFSDKVFLGASTLFTNDGLPAVYIVGQDPDISYVSSVAILNQLGLNISDTIDLPSSQTADYIDTGATLSPLIKNPDDSLWLITDNSSRRHLTPALAASDAFNIDTSDIVEVPNDYIKSFKSKPFITRLLRAEGTAKIFYVQNGSLRAVSSLSQITSLGYSLTDVTDVNQAFINTIPRGSAL